MKRITRFMMNALVLGSTTIFMRIVPVFFNAYVSGKVGAEGMGLYSLITSVYMFAVTLASSGVNLAVTRLVSEELGKNNNKGALAAVKNCAGFALIFSTSASVILFFGAEWIAGELLCDMRTFRSLRVLSVALPFIALSSVFSGYFSAVRRVSKSASASITEQFVKIFITVNLLLAIAPKGMEYACLALVIGTAVSEGLSFFYLFVFYLYDKRKHIRGDVGRAPKDIRKRMLSIVLPVALSSYLRSGLVTVEHILIPIGLRKHGADSSTALASYGVIHGMVFPLILFPSAITSTFAGLIVPELSELAARYKDVKGHPHICYIVGRALTFALLFGIGVGGIFLFFAEPLGMLVYGNEEAVRYIRVFAVLIPVMYLDTTVDGMLKGLGQQFHSMVYNVIDASMSVFLVWTLLPKVGIIGYVICVFITELVNLSFSISRLIAVTGVRLRIVRAVAIPILCIVGATTAVSLLLHTLPIFALLPSTIFGIALCLLVYIALLRITSGLSKEDTAWLRGIFQKT